MYVKMFDKTLIYVVATYLIIPIITIVRLLFVVMIQMICNLNCDSSFLNFHKVICHLTRGLCLPMKVSVHAQHSPSNPDKIKDELDNFVK